MARFAILLRWIAGAVQWSRWWHLKAMHWTAGTRATAHRARRVLNGIVVEVLDELMLRRSWTPWRVANGVRTA